MKIKSSFLILSTFLIACEPDRIDPKADCASSDLAVTVTNVVGASCSTNDGSISVSGSGGEAPYQYSLDEDNFQEEAVFADLSVGNYTITIKDANDCTATVESTVNNSAGFSIEASAEATNCTANDGSISVTPSGGEGPFQYQLDNGAFVDSGTFEDLAEGNYTITAKDANGCEAVTQVSVENAVSLEVALTTQTAGCGTSNGSITVSVDGGNEPYQYKIGNGAFGNSNIFNGLAVGNHNITVMDASGCNESISGKILSGIKFSSSISAIIANNCATSGCHNGSQSPDLSSFNGIQANAAAIKTATANGNMPKNGSLSQAQKDAIACWVNDGAPNN